MDRFDQQIGFILEIDKLKSVIRRTYLIDADRRENSAEHSWHLAIMAILLAEHANEAINVPRVVKMVLIHDVVEIDAGDTYIYDSAGGADKLERERGAAKRLFGLLPEDQAKEFSELWEEFENGETADARFAAALDRFIPQLHNYYTDGKSWQENRITADRVLARNQCMENGSVRMWEWTCNMIAEAVKKGILGAAPNL